MAYIPKKRPGKRYLNALDALWGTNPTPTQVKVKTVSKRPLSKPEGLSEASAQKCLVKWARSKHYFLISIPNQGKRSFGGHLHEIAMGLYKGAADLFLAHPIPPYGGYWIELKAKGRKLRPEQADFLLKMREMGYWAGWFDDWEKAKESIEAYLRQ